MRLVWCEQGCRGGEVEGLGLQDKDLGGVEDPVLGSSVAQCEGKPERFKFPQRTKYLSLCYMAFWHCYFILG